MIDSAQCHENPAQHDLFVDRDFYIDPLWLTLMREWMEDIGRRNVFQRGSPVIVYS